MVGRGHFGCIGHGFEGSRGGIGDTSAIPRGGGIANAWHAGLRAVAIRGRWGAFQMRKARI